MIITSKFPGKCKDCSAPIQPGDRVDWTKGVKGVQCMACSPAAKAEAAAVEESRAVDADCDVPAPEGLSYLPYQRGGIAYALSRKGALIGDEMGLGKTIQAIGVINGDPTIESVLVISPKSLTLNWVKELKKWLVRDLSVGRIPGESQIVCLSYEEAKKHRALLEKSWDLVIVDEAHYIKNQRAQRSKLVHAIAEGARRRIALTGTPIANRPIELFSILKMVDPDNWDPNGKGFFRFAKRYAGAYQDRFGWNFAGASNLEELQTRLRATCMVRRLKKDVLTELPPKQRQIIELPANGASRAVKAERDAWDRQAAQLEGLRAEAELARASDDPADYAEAVRRLGEATKAAFSEIAKLRHATAVAKVPHVIEHVRAQLEDDEDAKIIVMAHHHDVIDAIEAGLSDFGAVQLTGDTKLETRQANVEAFQSDPKCRVFIGSITAAGVGITLTASSHVVFAELDWVPGNVSQAEDRAHRIGQRNSVLVQHLVLEGSLDLRMAQILVEKQRVADEGLDVIVKREPVIPTVDKPSTESRRAELDKVAKTLDFAKVAAIHGCLRTLAGMCDGAQRLDGAGFAAIDVRIGHSLAEAASITPRQAALGLKLVRKYRRQLGPMAESLLAA